VKNSKHQASKTPVSHTLKLWPDTSSNIKGCESGIHLHVLKLITTCRKHDLQSIFSFHFTQF